MDRHLKERLVGAAVLVAAAIILIPEMLSGPHDGTQVQTQLPNGESDANGVKTYTIDLTAPNTKPSQELPAPAPTFQETAPAPPPETSASNSPNAAVAVPKESQAAAGPQVVTQPDRARDKDQQLLQEFTEQAKSDKRPAEKLAATETPPPKPKAEIEKSGEAAKGGAWAVQVASFGARATSERIASELKAKGFPSFVTSFATAGQTMYRVRVGPVEDRPAAEALLKKIKPLHPGAAVVPQ